MDIMLGPPDRIGQVSAPGQERGIFVISFSLFCRQAVTRRRWLGGGGLERCFDLIGRLIIAFGIGQGEGKAPGDDDFFAGVALGDHGFDGNQVASGGGGGGGFGGAIVHFGFRFLPKPGENPAGVWWGGRIRTLFRFDRAFDNHVRQRAGRGESAR